MGRGVAQDLQAAVETIVYLFHVPSLDVQGVRSFLFSISKIPMTLP